ncbi:MAG: hypothetical protein ACPLZF_06125 [Nitrososphaeria archaeon]
MSKSGYAKTILLLEKIWFHRNGKSPVQEQVDVHGQGEKRYYAPSHYHA